MEVLQTTAFPFRHLYNNLAPRAGFEPTSCGVEVRCLVQLDHRGIGTGDGTRTRKTQILSLVCKPIPSHPHYLLNKKYYTEYRTKSQALFLVLPTGLEPVTCANLAPMPRYKLGVLPLNYRSIGGTTGA